MCSLYNYISMEERPAFWVQWNSGLESNKEDQGKAGSAGDEKNSPELPATSPPPTQSVIADLV
jgi:hypothetical protein